jgi:hypothetical protein
MITLEQARKVKEQVKALLVNESASVGIIKIKDGYAVSVTTTQEKFSRDYPIMFLCDDNYVYVNYIFGRDEVFPLATKEL